MFNVTGNDVRISGLQLVAPSPRARTPASTRTSTRIQVFADYDAQLGRRVLIEENEFDQWSHAAVGVRGTHAVQRPEEWDPAWTKPVPADASLVRVERNYIHDNVMDAKGYGVVLAAAPSPPSPATCSTTTATRSRPAARPSAATSPAQLRPHDGIKENGSYYNQHFDVHGVGDGGYGGPAGTFFDIANNTIRGEQDYKLVKTRPAVMLRGKADRRDAVPRQRRRARRPRRGRGADQRRPQQDRHRRGPREVQLPPRPQPYDTDYSTEIASGDFDGDGRTDVFVANGTGWWYSRAGIKQWELLQPVDRAHRRPGFADIDNDGRTDVVSRDDAGKLGYYSAARAVPAAAHASCPDVGPALRRLRRRPQDRPVPHAQRPVVRLVRERRRWTPTQTSSAKITELLFGDFDATRAPTSSRSAATAGRTRAAARSVDALRAQLTSDFENAVVADFDGDGRDDIAVSSSSSWRYSVAAARRSP